MKIVVFGFDDYGEKIANIIEKKDVKIVVFNTEEEQKAKEKLYDVVSFKEINDDALKTLEEFDLAVAALRDEDKNLFLCLSLKELYPQRQLIAKVSQKGNEFKYRLAGVDKIINPYDVSANRIMTILQKPLTLKIIEEIVFQDNELSFAEIEIPENSFLDGKYIKDVDKEISKNYNILIIALVDKEMGGNVQFVTKGVNHKIDAGDVLVVVGDVFEIEQFKEDLNLFAKAKNG